MNKWTPTTDFMQLRRFGKTIEELGELTEVCARCIIQGIDEVDSKTGVVNRVRLENEIADVYAQLGCTADEFELDGDRIATRMLDKRRQMREWEAVFKPEEQR